MSLLYKFQFPLFAPEGSGGTTTVTEPASKEMSKEDVIEFLAEDTDDETIPIEKPEKKVKTEEPPDETEETPESEESEEDEDLKLLEDEITEPTEEQLELVTPVRRREILKKYPALFKDFPYLEKAYYREQQFTELLPTIADAKEAVQAKQVLDNFEKDLMSGNNETILKAVKSENPQAFNKVVDNYLLTLRNVDERAYFHVLGNTLKHTIKAMVDEARSSQNEQLQNAALLLNQFVFGTSQYTPPENLSKPERPEDKGKEAEITEREQRFVRQQFNATREDLNLRVNNTLRNTIQAHIDPKQSMTDYVRRNAERDALEKLEVLISNDKRFKALSDKLWEKAYQDGFSNEAKERIKSAYLSKAKTLLPSVIKEARNEAMRGIGKRVRDDSDTPEKDKKGPVLGGRPRSQTPSGKITNPKDIPKGMKTLDFLMGD
jgi:hypothetical protein